VDFPTLGAFLDEKESSGELSISTLVKLFALWVEMADNSDSPT